MNFILNFNNKILKQKNINTRYFDRLDDLLSDFSKLYHKANPNHLLANQPC